MSALLQLLLAGSLMAPVTTADEAVASKAAVPDADAPDIHLELRDADVREALRMVARQSGVDIVLSNAVEGRVTLELEGASLAETLDAIMSVSGLLYSAEGAIITVSTLDELIEQQRLTEELETARAGPEGQPVVAVRLFKLDYVDAERVESVVEPLLSENGSVAVMKTTDHLIQEALQNGQGGGAFGFAGGAAGGGGQGGGGQGGGGGGNQVQIGGRLTTTSQGAPARSHSLVVSDVPERLQAIASIIEELDTRPLQVQIEARFVEVVLGKDDKLGIDWNVAIRAAGAAVPTTFPFGFTSLGESNPYVTGGAVNELFPEAPNSVTLPGEPGLFTFGTLDLTTFTALLRMIDDDQSVQIVSNPRVLVQDRTTATILVGERFPILSTTITDQGTVTEELERYEPIGVQLEVTPSVLNDEEVELFVRPSTSTLGPIVQGSTGIQVARINTRQVDTSVTAFDGQTVMLGGLVSSRQVDVVRRVPFLSAIPLLGELFEYEASEVERVDLVVFLTVTLDREHGLTERQRRLFDRTTFDLPVPGEDDEAWWAPLDFTPSPVRFEGGVR